MEGQAAYIPTDTGGLWTREQLNAQKAEYVHICDGCDDRIPECGAGTPGECFDRLPPEAKAELVPPFLADLLQTLHGTRIATTHIRAVLDAKVAEFEARQDIIGLRLSLKEAEAFLKTSDADVRQAALTAYEKTGDKKPSEGISIKLMTDVLIDNDEAMAWAEQHAPIFIIKTLDRKSLEKLAKETPGLVPCAKVSHRAVVTIATDLSTVSVKGGA